MPAVEKMGAMPFMQEPPFCLQIFAGDDMDLTSAAPKVNLRKQYSVRKASGVISNVVAT